MMLSIEAPFAATTLSPDLNFQQEQINSIGLGPSFSRHNDVVMSELSDFNISQLQLRYQHQKLHIADSPANGPMNDVDVDGMDHAHSLSSTHTISHPHHTHPQSHLPLHPHPQEQPQNRDLLDVETDPCYTEDPRTELVNSASRRVLGDRENSTADRDERDLMMPIDEHSNSDYAARRASTTSTVSASAHSIHSTTSTATTSTVLSGLSGMSSITAATSHSALSNSLSVPTSTLKRGVSPEEYDYDYDYPSSEYPNTNTNSVIRSESPRGAKRARPTLSLGPSMPSQIPVSSRPVSAGEPGGPSFTSEAIRAQHTPIFSYGHNELDFGQIQDRDSINLGESASAPPTSHGLSSTSTSSSSSNSSVLGSGSYFGQTQGTDYPSSALHFNSAEHLSSSLGLNDTRRGSLPSLYSTSLATREMHSGTGGLAPSLLSQRSSSSIGSTGSSSYGYGNGSGYGGSPRSDNGLSGYQFPPSQSSGNTNSNPGSGQGSTPSSGATPTGTMGSPFPMSALSQSTTASCLSSASNSSFPQTPLDIVHRSRGDKGYASSGANMRPEEVKEIDRLEREYLNLDVPVVDSSGNGNGGWDGNGSSSGIVRSSSTPSSASTNGGSMFGFGGTGNSVLGGLPRISGHTHSGMASSTSTSSSHNQSQQVMPISQTSQHQQQQRRQQQQTASLSPSRSNSLPLSPNTAAAAAAAAASLNVSPAAAASAAQVAAQVAARPARRRGKLPKPTTDFLKDWLHRHSDHPYPSEEEKKQLCLATGLSMSQVSNWMINARRRILAPAQRVQSNLTTTVPSSYPPSSHVVSHHSSHGSSPYAHPHSVHSSLSQHDNGHSIGPTRTSLSYTSSHPYGGSSGNMSGLGSGLGPGSSARGMGGMGGMMSGLHSASSAGANGLGMNGIGLGYPNQQIRSVQSSTGLYQQQYRQSMGVNGGMGMSSFGSGNGMGLGGLGMGTGMGYDVNSRRASMPTLHHSQHASSTSPSSMVPNNYPSSSHYASHSSSNMMPSSSVSPASMGSGLQLYQTQTSGGRGSLPMPLSLPGSSTGHYTSPQPARGYVFPDTSADGGNTSSMGGA